ncbi:MAG TPA: class I SAM-dependent methyltransferase [Candidatus Eisenbacteria bacterium]
MPSTEPLIRNISDTARWVAVYRARETERPDALFRDPYARRLAGKRGEEIAAVMDARSRADWPFPIRTYLFDSLIAEHVRGGGDRVVNLAAGLDTEVRSYMKWAARKGRLNPVMRLLALLPESKGRQGSRPWAAVCLLEKRGP